MLQVEERTKTACGTDGFAPDLTALEAQVRSMHVEDGCVNATLPCEVLFRRLSLHFKFLL